MPTIFCCGLGGPENLSPNGSGRIGSPKIAKYPTRSIQPSRGFYRIENSDMQVYANDLNPRSSHYLDINVKLNKVPSLCST